MPARSTTKRLERTSEIRRVTSDLHNPYGDSRSNRAHWRSPLDKSKIPTGYRYRVERWLAPVEHAGQHLGDVPHVSLRDADSGSGFTHGPAGSDAFKLAAILESYSVPDAETLDSVRERHGYGVPSAFDAVCRALDVTPARLDEILTADAVEETATLDVIAETLATPDAKPSA